MKLKNCRVRGGKTMYNVALKRKWDKQAILDQEVLTAKKEEREKAEHRSSRER